MAGRRTKADRALVETEPRDFDEAEPRDWAEADSSPSNEAEPSDLGEAEARKLVEADRRRGRGARSNRVGRFESELREPFDDGWEGLADLEPFKTDVHREMAKSIISTNDSPDISFEQSINPYRGCEHGCIYCYARPTHCYLGHSAGLDFETKLYAKVNAAELLERELAKPRYVPKFIALGAVTDPYQPIEREHRITRGVLEVLERTGHPVGIVTKSALVVRDVDILARMAARGLAKVAMSVTTLDRAIARKMEPRAATPPRRLEAIKALSAAGVPVVVMVAPIIPGHQRQRDRAHPGCGPGGRRQRGRLRAAAAAAGDQGAVPRVVAHRVPEPRRARHQRAALDARRQGLQPRMGRAPARPRTLCRADRLAVPPGRQAAGPQPAHLQAAHRPVPRPGCRRAASSTCFDSGRRYREGPPEREG